MMGGWMQLSDVVVGLGFVLIVEGFPLFLSPSRYRRLLMQIEQVPDPVLRGTGFVAMCGGLVMLYVVR